VSQHQLDGVVRSLGVLAVPQPTVTMLHEAAAARGEHPARASMEGLVGIISADAGLTANFLRVVNSTRPAETLNTVAMGAKELGLRRLRSIVLSGKLASVRSDESPDSALDLPGFERHCLAVGSAAEMIAEKLSSSVDPAHAFTCGLLHDVGKLVLSQVLPKSYRRVLERVNQGSGNIADYERQIIGTDHTIAARRLAEHWKLGQSFQQVLWMHHHPIETLPASLSERQLVGIVSLADTIARQQRFGFSGNYVFPQSSRQIAVEIGLSLEDLDEILECLPERIEQHAEGLGLEGADSAKLYREALTNAAAELDRLNEELRRHQDRLSRQARTFGHFREFAKQLSPDASLTDALVGIAKVTRSAVRPPGETDIPRKIVAYSVALHQREVLTVELEAGETTKWRTLTGDQAQRAAECAGESGSGRDLTEVLLNDPQHPSEWIDPAAYWNRRFFCSGRWIGGVLYPSGRSEQDETGGNSAIEALTEAMGMALAIVQGRNEAVLLSEQLSQASQVLTETQAALAETKVQAVVGEMAGGAAHEINGPLAVISGRAQLMREKARTEEERKTWGIIADQAQRISDTISELMEFASPPEPRCEAFDPYELLRSAAEGFARSDHPQAASAHVDIDTGPALPTAWADRKQVQDVVEELIANAAGASSGKSAIRISARSSETADTVILSVSDSGGGMDEETALRAFTPFFSHHKAGRRRGLGLARAKRWIENNGGAIWIDTRPGEGTSVYVELPAGK